MIRQRISVPELIAEKGKNYLVLLSAMLSIISIFCITFFREKTMIFTKKTFHLTDNIFYVIFLNCSLVICYLTYFLLKKIELFGIEAESKFLYFKKMILVGMGVNLTLYLSCLIIISFYQPIIPVEQRFTSVLMVFKEINSVMFVLNYLFFILTMKNDLYFIQQTLETRPDLEFFIDTEEHSKYVLYERGSSH